APASQPADWPPNLPWSPEYYAILDPDVPIVVVTYDTRPYTLSNPFEAQTVAALTYIYRQALLAARVRHRVADFWNQQLVIVTPHRAQMSSIRNLLIDAAGLPSEPPPAVDTVDRFQGQERDLMIASYAVADRDFARA